MTTTALPPTPAPASPRLLDQLRLTARERGHAEPTVAAMADSCRRFILFHGKRHPRDLGLPEVGQFLESIAQTDKNPVRAIAAVLFLYKQVLDIDLGRLDAMRARRPKRLPVVLAPEKVAAVLQRVDCCAWIFQLMARAVSIRTLPSLPIGCPASSG